MKGELISDICTYICTYNYVMGVTSVLTHNYFDAYMQLSSIAASYTYMLQTHMHHMATTYGVAGTAMVAPLLSLHSNTFLLYKSAKNCYV